VTTTRFSRWPALAALMLSASGCVVQPATYEPQAAPPPVSEPVGYVSASVAPPPLPVYEQPACPGDGYLWAPGYWQYAPAGYFWVPGTWVMPPRVGLLWTPGYWGWNAGVYMFHEGYWGPTVGYYGGINYGGGYVGAGYYGGRWVNNQFHYNAAVSNVNVTNVHNVYRETTVVNNVTVINNVTNVSYAGGPGGSTARPSHGELEAARAPHVHPTPVQLQHRDDAGANPEQFVTHNQGHPPIAATPRPSAFTAPQATAAHGAVPRERGDYRAPGQRDDHRPPAPAPQAQSQQARAAGPNEGYRGQGQQDYRPPGQTPQAQPAVQSQSRPPAPHEDYRTSGQPPRSEAQQARPPAHGEEHHPQGQPQQSKPASQAHEAQPQQAHSGGSSPPAKSSPANGEKEHEHESPH
jgi:WXXGXW repeat (2 copies)